MIVNRILCFLFLILFACQPKQQAIEYGHDGCQYCKMTIMDKQYGTELVSKTSKTYKFDSVECLIDFLNKGEIKEGDVAFILVTSHDDPGKLKDGRTSYFLHSKELPSPMGMFLTAFDTKEAAMASQEKYGGEVFDWKTLNQKFNLLK